VWWKYSLYQEPSSQIGNLFEVIYISLWFYRHVFVYVRYSAESRGSSSSVYSNDLTHQQLAYLDTSRTPAHQAALMFSRGLDRPTLPAHRVKSLLVNF